MKSVSAKNENSVAVVVDVNATTTWYGVTKIRQNSGEKTQRQR